MPWIWALLAAASALFVPVNASWAATYSLKEALSYAFSDELVSAEASDRIAWVRMVRGVRNILVADGPDFAPRQVTRYAEDDGQELTQLTLSPDGKTLVYVRGGDHGENWPAKGDLAPDPATTGVEPKITIWLADLVGGKAPAKITDGDAPAISAKGVLAYIKDHQVWTAALDGSGARRLFFDRGHDDELAWSPDGARLAFVSGRDDHAFVGVFTVKDASIRWMAPSTGLDGSPVWSPNGKRLAFTRRPGRGGHPDPLLTLTPQPWAIWTAEAETGAGRDIWQSANTLRDSFPDTLGPNLHWLKGGLAFLSEADGWPHLYAVRESGGEPLLLTPGTFMVEDVAATRDRSALVYSANTGHRLGDGDRRHLFQVALDGRPPAALTGGEGLEWRPATVRDGVAFVGAGVRDAPTIQIVGTDGGGRRTLAGQSPSADFAGARFVVPRPVTFQSPDGLTLHGQLFALAGRAGNGPGLVFVHGGPPRQMMLGWHYMSYYTHAYAMNQYFADHGYAVLSVNYRLGIGYGHDFANPEHSGPAGAAEYQDVLAGARFLQRVPGVDPARIGIYGGSYGGYLAALALARNSDVFKAGVDLHGVHDWSRSNGEQLEDLKGRFDQGDRAVANFVAWASSPVADIARWTSPVLLVQGDDDRNVLFNQTIDLVDRLQAKGVPHEELVLPDEIHDFLRYASWLKSDTAMVDFFSRKLGGEPDGH